jgi:hypothetical protein
MIQLGMNEKGKPIQREGGENMETPKQMQKALMEEMGLTQDEAAHMLVDAGEINSTDHADLLTDAERTRIYG